MSTLAIEINDANLIIADRSGVLGSEPGYASLKEGHVVTGTEAYSQARLRPRESSNRYWENLSLEDGSAGIDGVANTAQLAFAQLERIWERYGSESEDALFVVPDHFTREQLGLLLGLSQECGMPVRALVNAAVAASVRPYPGRQLVYLDASVSRVAATTLEQGNEVAAENEQAIEGAGLGSLMDQWAKRVAELFVLSTRFDPFHDAASEQLVYDRLPAWLESLEKKERAELSLPHGGDEISVEVQRDQLLGVAAGFYRAVVQLLAQCRSSGDSAVVQVSDRLYGLPGVVNELARLDDAHIVPMPAGAAALGALQSLDRIDSSGGQVKLLKRLPWRAAAEAAMPETGQHLAPAAPAPKRTEGSATHIVYRGIAIPVDGNGVLIGREDHADRRTIVLNGDHGGVSRSHCELVRRDGELRLKDLSQYGTFVNEKRVSGDLAIQPADVIRIGSPGEELQAITIEGTDGP